MRQYRCQKGIEAMAVYIITTQQTSKTAADVHPYNEYIRKLETAQEKGLFNQSFDIDLSPCALFETDADYFFHPSMKFTFFHIDSGENPERVMIRHCLCFEMDSGAREAVMDGLGNIRDRLNAIYIPDVQEHSVQYEISGCEAKLIMHVCVMTQNVKKAGMALISLDAACMAKGW